jgi:hypothetical protein
MHRWTKIGVVAALDLCVLGLDRPRFGELANRLAAPRAWLRADGTDRALASVAAAALWIAALWLACGLLALSLAHVPGAVGRLGQLVGRRIVPRTVRSLLAGSAGLGILVAPIAAVAHPAAEHRAPSGAAATLPSPTWPVDPPSTRVVRTPHWPSAPISGDDAPHHRSTQTDEVRVRPGDSLWLIAQRRVGPHASPARVAREWPRWYAANRTAIGPDPGLIRPGDVLHAPKAHR